VVLGSILELSVGNCWVEVHIVPVVSIDINLIIFVGFLKENKNTQRSYIDDKWLVNCVESESGKSLIQKLFESLIDKNSSSFVETRFEWFDLERGFRFDVFEFNHYNFINKFLMIFFVHFLIIKMGLVF
jgi:hypothetical protein